MGSGPTPTTVSFKEAHRRAHTGTDLTRLIALADGVFAFALTLLVLQLTVPSGVCAGTPPPSGGRCSTLLSLALSKEYAAFAGYVEAFLLIAVWWVSHHRVFRFVERYDGALLWLNLAFLMTVAIAPFTVGLFIQYPEATPALLLFSVEMASAGILLASIWIYADRRGLLSAEADPVIRRYFQIRGWVLPSFFLAGALVSLVTPGVVQFIWLAAFVVSFSMRRYG
ncbi:MAG TPA: TMEM175 family protein [Thermoplasmata archaeon]|nr:TMEM175 family protein [Thermoplasmata archaeon]